MNTTHTWWVNRGSPPVNPLWVWHSDAQHIHRAIKHDCWNSVNVDYLPRPNSPTRTIFKACLLQTFSEALLPCLSLYVIWDETIQRWTHLERIYRVGQGLQKAGTALSNSPVCSDKDLIADYSTNMIYQGYQLARSQSTCFFTLLMVLSPLGQYGATGHSQWNIFVAQLVNMWKTSKIHTQVLIKESGTLLSFRW